MSPIKEFPQIAYLGHGKGWVLTADLTYFHPKYGNIVVKKGFRTDLDSVPRLPFAYWLTKDASVVGAVIHDWLYKQGEINDYKLDRKEADDVFLDIMKEEGVSLWQRRMIWFGVRIGGWHAWNKHRAAQKAREAEEADDGHNPPPPRKPPALH